MMQLSGARLKRSVRILVLGAFATCLIIGRLGFWAGAFVLGLVMEAIKPGRLYCMWLCPVRAAHGLAGSGCAVKKKKGAPIAGTKAVKAYGRAFIASFLVLFGGSIVLGLRGWLFPSFVALGIVASSVISLQSFCSGLCPFGAAFVVARRIPATVTGLFRSFSLMRSPDRRGIHR